MKMEINTPRNRDPKFDKVAELIAKPSHVHDLLDGLRAGLTLPGWCDPPMSLETGERLSEILVFKNVLVEAASGARVAASPKHWLHSSVDYPWQPEAGCPQWRRFLNSVFPSDHEAQDCIEEFLGLSMTGDLLSRRAHC